MPGLWQGDPRRLALTKNHATPFGYPVLDLLSEVVTVSTFAGTAFIIVGVHGVFLQSRD